jgi:hypothetical protein
VRLRLAPAVITFACVAAPGEARAEASGLLSAGYMHTWVSGSSPTFGNGAELTWMHYSKRESSEQPFAFGAFAQASSYGGTHARTALGGQLTYHRFIGLELGWAHRGAHDDRSATNGVQVTPFLTLGLVVLGAQWTIIPREPNDLSATLSFKLPVALLYGEYPVLFPGKDLRLWSGGAGGRPLRTDEGVVLPEVRVGRRRSAPRSELLASLWLDDARMEHASVAAFCRLALELLTHGAPASLVRRAHRAAAQEIVHATDCFALASRYAGFQLSAGAMDLPPLRVRDLAAIARESFLDGCIGEGVAAATARAGARATTDAAVRRVLNRIARDEGEHAELAWDVVAFTLARGGADVARALAEVRADPVLRRASPVAEDLARHGRIVGRRATLLRQRVARAALARLTNVATAVGRSASVARWHATSRES